MRKQTNLVEVKLTALALLSTEINETPYSPMIVKHPFTDTGVSAIPDGKGGVEMIDLTEDDAQLRWRQSMARQIDKADSAYAIYVLNCGQLEAEDTYKPDLESNVWFKPSWGGNVTWKSITLTHTGECDECKAR